jgi:hypothetical protein
MINLLALGAAPSRHTMTVGQDGLKYGYASTFYGTLSPLTYDGKTVTRIFQNQDTGSSQYGEWTIVIPTAVQDAWGRIEFFRGSTQIGFLLASEFLYTSGGTWAGAETNWLIAFGETLTLNIYPPGA